MIGYQKLINGLSVKELPKVKDPYINVDRGVINIYYSDAKENPYNDQVTRYIKDKLIKHQSAQAYFEYNHPYPIKPIKTNDLFEPSNNTKYDYMDQRYKNYSDNLIDQSYVETKDQMYYKPIDYSGDHGENVMRKRNVYSNTYFVENKQI